MGKRMTPPQIEISEGKWNSHSSGDTTGNQRLRNTHNRITRSLDSFSRELRLFGKVDNRRYRRFACFNILRSHETLTKESLVWQSLYDEDRDLSFQAQFARQPINSPVIIGEEKPAFVRSRWACWPVERGGVERLDRCDGAWNQTLYSKTIASTITLPIVQKKLDTRSTGPPRINKEYSSACRSRSLLVSSNKP